MKHEGDTMGKGKQTIRSLSKKAVLIRTRLPKKTRDVNTWKKLKFVNCECQFTQTKL